MENARITSADLTGKGVVGLPDVPGLSAADMQAKLDEIATDVLVPKHNAMIDALAGADGASAIGAESGTVADHIAARDNPHAVTAAHVGAYTKTETDARISQRVNDIGAGDMARAVYDTNQDGVVDDSDRLGGNAPGYFAKADDAFSTYIHVKDGTVHTLTGSGDNIKFVAQGDFYEGDTFVVNGAAVTAATSDGQALTDECFTQGNVVCCFKHGAILNFKQGGGALDYKVIAVAGESSLPDTTANNTLAVVTTTPITGHVFCALKPASPTQGLVWFETNLSSTIAFSAVKKNTLYVYPQKCYQYNAGSWQAKTMFLYQDKAWRSTAFYIFKNGDQIEAVTGGWVHDPVGSSVITYNAAWIRVEQAKNTTSTRLMAGTRPAKSIDLTGIKTIRAVLSGYAAGGNNDWGIGVSAALATTTSTLAAQQVKTGQYGKTTFTLDVSALSGRYYIYARTSVYASSDTADFLMYEVELMS